MLLKILWVLKVSGHNTCNVQTDIELQNRADFLYMHSSFGVIKQILLLFFMFLIMSILQYCNSIWYNV